MPPCEKQPYDLPEEDERECVVTLNDVDLAIPLLADCARKAGFPSRTLTTNDPDEAFLRVHRDLGVAVTGPGVSRWLLDAIQERPADFDSVRVVERADVRAAPLFNERGRDAKRRIKGGNLERWPLKLTNVETSKRTGEGVKVAVLDSGIDSDRGFFHKDFQDRDIEIKSFVPGRSPWDDAGHGTHTLGLACGPRNPKEGIRYGVAYEAKIYVGKVLVHPDKKTRKTVGLDSWIINGIRWAIDNGCQIVCLALGGSKPSCRKAYEEVARRALDAGAVLIAAGGNRSRRDAEPPHLATVEYPAAFEGFLAVGSMGPNLQGEYQISNTSPTRRPGEAGGAVDIVAPGQGMWSSWRSCDQAYKDLDGTSPAAGIVAGIGALLAQSVDGAPAPRGKALWELLATGAPLPGCSADDQGGGLVQAPK